MENIQTFYLYVQDKNIDPLPKTNYYYNIR